MLSMTKSREYDEIQTLCYFISRRHCGEDVKFGKDSEDDPVCFLDKAIFI